jgi:hypothetical protein
MCKVCTLGLVLISISGGSCQLLVLLSPFMPLKGFQHSGGVDGSASTGLV